jgi:hypothetical protein
LHLGASPLVAVPTELVPVVVLKANLHPTVRKILIGISGAAVHIPVVTLHSAVSTGGAMAHIFHHSPHVLLTHAIHTHAILVALLGGPVLINASIFGALSVPVARLV